MFDIAIDYTTGNSFNSERVNNEMLCNLVTSLDDAKENLKRVKEHYIKYEAAPLSDDAYELTLLIDNGERTITPFWIGYFETLHGAKVVEDKNNDMSFEF